jgi:hypothetical protein
MYFIPCGTENPERARFCYQYSADSNGKVFEQFRTEQRMAANSTGYDGYDWRTTLQWRVFRRAMNNNLARFVASPAAVAVVAFALFGCQDVTNASEKPKDSPQEQDLRITLGGFIENHPDRGVLGGVCGTDTTRNVLNCDIYNGLLDWTVTEITLVVTWLPYNDDDKRYYREAVSIESLKTSPLSVRLGLQLPLDDVVKRRNGPSTTMKRWAWAIASAKGLPRQVGGDSGGASRRP